MFKFFKKKGINNNPIVKHSKKDIYDMTAFELILGLRKKLKGTDTSIETIFYNDSQQYRVRIGYREDGKRKYFKQSGNSLQYCYAKILERVNAYLTTNQF